LEAYKQRLDEAGWELMTDEATGTVFYFNRATDESTWDAPFPPDVEPAQTPAQADTETPARATEPAESAADEQTAPDATAAEANAAAEAEAAAAAAKEAYKLRRAEEAERVKAEQIKAEEEKAARAEKNRQFREKLAAEERARRSSGGESPQAAAASPAAAAGGAEEVIAFLDANGLANYYGLFASCKTMAHVNRMRTVAQIRTASKRVPEFKGMTPKMHDEVASAVRAGLESLKK
jgi:hypothetical protein